MNIEDIRRDADPTTFPFDLVTDAMDAACFFSAAFHGRNDVIHLASIPFVVLVDIDERGMMEMHRAYPSGWSYRVEDAYLHAAALAESGTRFDLVTVDPWTADIGRALDHLPLWLSVTRRSLVIGACKDWFAAKRLEPTLDAVNEWIKRAHWNGAMVPPASRLVRRSWYRGGVWWIVFDDVGGMLAESGAATPSVGSTPNPSTTDTSWHGPGEEGR